MSEYSHLDELEAEAIYIIREVAAECEKPVMLYSIGKDSSVMLHLAMKAFYPEKPPFREFNNPTDKTIYFFGVYLAALAANIFAEEELNGVDRTFLDA